MKIGFIGIGRMGNLLVQKLVISGIEIVIYNRTKGKTDKLTSEFNHNCFSSYTPQEFVTKLFAPRIIWIMVSAGPAVDDVISQLIPFLEKGDILIDGGNSFYKDSQRRYRELKVKGIHFLDVGTSGGLGVLENGASLMVGGDPGVYADVKPLFEVLSKPNGAYDYFGPSGAGHFVKMVHNGIEYGMLESIGEGFSLLAAGPDFAIQLPKAARVFSKGSIVRGYLMDLTESIFKKDHRLSSIKGVSGGGETGSWAVLTAKEAGVSLPNIEQAVKERIKSVKTPSFTGKVIASLRNEFGGHPIVIKK